MVKDIFFELILCQIFFIMIQRSQSLYLFLVFLSSLCLLIFPVFEANINIQNYLLSLLSSTNGSPLYWFVVFISTLISGFSAFITIFFYKNRQVQLKLIKVNLLIIFLLIAALFIAINNADISYKKCTILVFSPILMLLFSFIAKRNINKDDALVKSADRIR